MPAQNDPDLFQDPRLGFRVRKPADWSFMPPAWSAVQQWKHSAEDPQDWIHLANKPFCCAMKHHDSEAHAYPTLQATVRPGRIGPGDVQPFLEAQMLDLRTRFPDIRFLDHTSDAVLGGHRANRIEATFRLHGRHATFGVRTRSYAVFAPRYVFTIGLSGSDDPAFSGHDDFDRIETSVRIRT